jgi:hypothetical protein
MSLNVKTDGLATHNALLKLLQVLMLPVQRGFDLRNACVQL